MDPWGSTSDFPDKEAQWIWNLKTAAVDAPSAPIKFSNQWYNKTNADVQAVLHTIVDNQGEVFLNGKKVGDIKGAGWVTKEYSKMDVTLKPGNNVIDIVALNVDGPAALIVSLVAKSNNGVLLRSDSTWVTNAV